MTNEWEKVTAEPTWDFLTEKEIEGVFVRLEENIGPNNSKIYTLELPKGERIGVWGNSVLDSRMKNMEPGEEVRIEYLGKVESQKTKGRMYHNFEVYHRKPDFSKITGEGIDRPEDKDVKVSDDDIKDIGKKI